jgi:DnaJ-domain-containing protein 1
VFLSVPQVEISDIIKYDYQFHRDLDFDLSARKVARLVAICDDNFLLGDIGNQADSHLAIKNLVFNDLISQTMFEISKLMGNDRNREQQPFGD